MKKIDDLINDLLNIKDTVNTINYDKKASEVYNTLYNYQDEDWYNTKLEDLKYRFEDLDWIESIIKEWIDENWIANTLHFYKDCNFDYDNHFKIDEYWYVENIDENEVKWWIDDIISELEYLK